MPKFSFENKNQLALVIISSVLVLVAINVAINLAIVANRARVASNSNNTVTGLTNNQAGSVSGQSNVVASQKANSIQISDVTGSDPTIADVVRKASSHIALPDGRVAVVTILNVDALKKENPIFYRFARDGDKAILYPDRAILYNPQLDKIIDVWHMVERIR